MSTTAQPYEMTVAHKFIGALIAAMPRDQRYSVLHREKRRAQWKKSREVNKAQRAAYMKKWKAKRKRHVHAYRKRWEARQPEKFWHRWPSCKPQKKRKPGRTYEQELECNRQRRADARRELMDSYIRGWMSRLTGYTVKPSRWNKRTVENKRRQLRLCRTRQQFKLLAGAAQLSRALGGSLKR